MKHEVERLRKDMLRTNNAKIIKITMIQSEELNFKFSDILHILTFNEDMKEDFNVYEHTLESVSIETDREKHFVNSKNIDKTYLADKQITCLHYVLQVQNEVIQELEVY